MFCFVFGSTRDLFLHQNANSGGPCPTISFSMTLVKNISAGDTTVYFNPQELQAQPWSTVSLFIYASLASYMYHFMLFDGH